MSNFQIIILGVFLFFIFLGVVLFAGFGGEGDVQSVGAVTIWGTFDKNIIDDLLADLRREDRAFSEVKYQEMNESSFDEDLAEALASGRGPDVFILPQYSILKHENKIFPIPYENYPIRDFKDRFIEEGELYLSNKGTLAFPFVVDPLVMYWNRDIFTREGISVPPSKWEDFFALSGEITKKDSNLNILTSFVSFGEFRNVDHAKEIVSTLIMQAGSPITTREGEDLNILLAKKTEGTSVIPAEEALNFYTQFSNPVKSVYTWNRSLPSSEKSFLAGDLAIYFGFASEIESLRVKNPNLNFDVALVPQTNTDNNITFGKMYGLAITKSSKNIGGSYEAIKKLTSNPVLVNISELNHLPPVSRSLLASRPSDPYLDIFYRAAVYSKAWLDPNPEETNSIFMEMVESIIFGKSRVGRAVSQAGAEMRVLVE